MKSYHSFTQILLLNLYYIFDFPLCNVFYKNILNFLYNRCMDYYVINKEKIKYTKLHRKALMKCIKDNKISVIKAYGPDMYTALIKRAEVHDMDKIAYLHTM